jgi:DNA-binding Lrp family transcriptional regulator
MSSVLEMKIIALLQDDIPTTENPYATMAKLLQLSEAELVEKLKSLQQEGKLKRIAAILHHKQAGYAENAMAVFVAAPDEIDRIGQALATSPLVSHCYRRQSYPDWPYNLYAMCHSRDSDAITLMVEAFAKAQGISHFAILPSIRELKKTSLRFSR